MTFAQALENQQNADHPPETAGTLPAGFDPDLYLVLNDDVAAVEGLDPADHYRDFGAGEFRSVLAPGQGLHHDASRMMTEGERFNWLNVLKSALNNPEINYDMEEIIALHPRAGWLITGFTLPAYLVNHRDVAHAVDHPLQAAFHYLEIGIERKHLIHPDRDKVVNAVRSTLACRR